MRWPSRLSSDASSTPRRQGFGRDIPLLIPLRRPSAHPNPTLLSLLDLPEPIIVQILSFLQSSSDDLEDDDDMRALAITNSFLYDRVRYVQQRNVTINPVRVAHAQDRLKLIMRRHLITVIRVLRLSSPSGLYRSVEQGGVWKAEEEQRTTVYRFVADMLPCMSGLQDFHLEMKLSNPHYNHPLAMTRRILLHLPSSVRLHVTLYCGSTDGDHIYTRGFLNFLANNKNLYSLDVDISVNKETEGRETSQILRTVLLTSPNLTHIPRLSIFYPPSGWCGTTDAMRPRQPYFGLGFSAGQCPPALEEIGIGEYPWGHKASRPDWEAYTVGYPEDEEPEQIYWANTFDWSRLRRLGPVPVELGLMIAPRLTSLEEVRFPNAFGSKMADFLDSTPTDQLSSLAFDGWSEHPKDPYDERWLGSIIRHGVALRILRTDRYQTWWGGPTFIIGKDDLARLCDGAPHLEELGISVPDSSHYDEWLDTALEVVTRLPNLKRLILAFRMDVITEESRASYPTVRTAGSLFRALRQQQATTRTENGSCCPQLRRLELRLGDDKGVDIFDGPSWIRADNNITLVCEVPVAHGDADGGFAKVTCKELSSGLNVELRRLADERRQEGGEILDLELAQKYPRQFKVALDGPLTDDEFAALRNARRETAEAAERKGNKGWKSRYFSYLST